MDSKTAVEQEKVRSKAINFGLLSYLGSMLFYMNSINNLDVLRKNSSFLWNPKGFA